MNFNEYQWIENENNHAYKLFIKIIRTKPIHLLFYIKDLKYYFLENFDYKIHERSGDSEAQKHPM